MILHGKGIRSFPLCVEVHRRPSHCRPSDGLSVHIQRVVSARGYSGCPVLASACILHVPLVIVIAPYLPALELLAALLEPEGFNRQRLLAYSVCHGADLRRCLCGICLMILHGKGICSFPLCVEVHRCSGYCRLSYRLSVHIQRVVSARGYSGCPVLASVCILHVPLVIVIAPYLPALELLAALLEPEGFNRQRLLAYSVCHGADLRRCLCGICLMILYGKCICSFPLCVEVHRSPGHSRLSYGLPVHIQGVISARRYRSRPILASVSVLHIPLVIVIAPYLPALELLSALLEPEGFNRQRLLAYSVCHGADLRRCLCGICLMILYGKCIISFPLCVEVHRRPSHCRPSDGLSVHIKGIVSACRNFGRPVLASACILDIPLVIVITVYLPALELLPALLESQRLNGQRLLAYSVCHGADLRGGCCVIRLVILYRKCILGSDYITYSLNMGRYSDISVNYRVSAHCSRYGT